MAHLTNSLFAKLGLYRTYAMSPSRYVVILQLASLPPTVLVVLDFERQCHLSLIYFPGLYRTVAFDHPNFYTIEAR